MKDRQVILARCLAGVVCVVCGGALQLSLWKNSQRSILEAFTHWPVLWIVYLFASFLIGEHILRWMKRRNDSRDDGKKQ
jgi:hypothetical protein